LAVFGQWERSGSRWKIPLLEQVLSGSEFTGKRSTPWSENSVHDFMHAKVTVCDETVFVGSFNLSRSGERNAENVLEIEDAALAGRLCAWIDEVRARFPDVEPPRR
jgi:phosphatidylserine/phosphatidylglycerophosphate/cardiolipin synthase-like enzyme